MTLKMTPEFKFTETNSGNANLVEGAAPRKHPVSTRTMHMTHTTHVTHTPTGVGGTEMPRHSTPVLQERIPREHRPPQGGEQTVEGVQFTRQISQVLEK